MALGLTGTSLDHVMSGDDNVSNDEAGSADPQASIGWLAMPAILSPSVTKGLCSYAIKTLMVPVKELFVVAWACQQPHLHNINTSRVESGHAYLKMFTAGNSLSVFKSLGLAVDNQTTTSTSHRLGEGNVS
ncbi:hypothetical protein H4Q26_007651 [Puccinia striiformis f. sp. tritici PST-130]|nr:hypothetical protein H4Q26_007651 [Puccinia striiformis f. sp. tritici PST-130]